MTPMSKAQLQRTYDHLRLEAKGVSRHEFLQNPCYFLRLIGTGEIDVRPQAATHRTLH